MNFLRYVVVIIEQYIVPFLLAIGLIFFIYAIIFYFIMGGESDKREEGRIYFIKSNLWFFFGLLLYTILALLVWMFSGIPELFNTARDGVLDGSGTGAGNANTDVNGDGVIDSRDNIDVTKNQNVLPLPNVPGAN